MRRRGEWRRRRGGRLLRLLRRVVGALVEREGREASVARRENMSVLVVRLGVGQELRVQKPARVVVLARADQIREEREEEDWDEVVPLCYTHRHERTPTTKAALGLSRSLDADFRRYSWTWCCTNTEEKRRSLSSRRSKAVGSCPWKKTEIELSAHHEPTIIFRAIQFDSYTLA